MSTAFMVSISLIIITGLYILSIYNNLIKLKNRVKSLERY